MSNKANKYKIGVLVVISFSVLIIGLILLGSLKFLKPKLEAMTVVDNTVQGLEKGAKVKFRGVTIGQVNNIDIGLDEKNIYIYMLFDGDAITLDAKRHDMDLEEFVEKFVDERVKDGLRCQLRYGGITGNLYMEISYFDPKKYPVVDYKLPPKSPPYIPSAPPILLGNLLEAAQKSMENLSKVDFGKLSDQLDNFLTAANKLISDTDIQEVLSDLKVTAKNLNEISGTLKTSITKKRIDKMTKQMDETAKNLNRALVQLDKFAQAAQKEMDEAKIPETSKSARDLFNNSDKALKRLVELDKDFKVTLERLNEAIIAARSLMDYLEKHPNSIIRGKPNTQVVAP